MRPPIFSELAFDAALEASKSAKKLLLVDATASWCQPCKHMDRTTWVDGGVIQAIGASAVAIQVDVDAEKELAKTLGIQAMPTVVAFRDGKEIDRVVGMQAPAALVAWLDALARGETSLDLARKAAAEKPEDTAAQLAFARALVQAGAWGEATTVYAKLWESVPQDDLSAATMKYSFFAQAIGKLAAQHPPAREAFARIRDGKAEGTLEWFSLNRALGDADRTLAWYETIRDRLASDEELAKTVEGAVVPLLVAAGRWADAGRAYTNPKRMLENIVAIRTKALEGTKLDAEQAKDVSAIIGQITTGEVTTLRRALAAAGRDEELRAIEEAAAKVDPAWVLPLPK